jgi:putative holliday junction resolvase
LRYLAIDYGARRLGIALSDAGGKFASPYEVIAVNDSKLAIERIVAITKREGAERLVVGLPINMDDSIGPAARQVVAWGRELSRRCELPIDFVDERLSSFAADEQLSERRRAGERLTHKGKKKRLDAVAATLFLQAMLDGKIHSIDLPDEQK